MLSCFRLPFVDRVPVEHHPRKVGVQTGANPKVITKAFKESARFYVVGMVRVEKHPHPYF